MADDATEMPTIKSLEEWASSLTSDRGEEVDTALFQILVKVYHKGLWRESNFKRLGAQYVFFNVKNSAERNNYIVKRNRIQEFNYKKALGFRILHEGGGANAVEQMQSRINRVKNIIKSLFIWYAANNVAVTELG